MRTNHALTVVLCLATSPLAQALTAPHLTPPKLTTPPSTSVQTACSAGSCSVTVNGETRTYPGSTAQVQVTSANGVTQYTVLVDGQVVDRR